MAKVPPVHSTERGYRPVYHDDDRCPERTKIKRNDVFLGTGGLPKCEGCMTLRSSGRKPRSKNTRKEGET